MNFLPAFVLAAVVFMTSTRAAECKCTPGGSCWPSADEWSAFNKTINGSLIIGQPPAVVCYPGPAFDQAACNQVLGSWFDSKFHASDPISTDWPFWANNSCNPIFSNGTSKTGDPTAGPQGCTIGNYPPYAVNATTTDIVAATVKWAAQKNIRLVIKNTGHSFTGRSLGFGSLSVWTHHMRGFHFYTDWKSSGCPSNSSSGQMAASIAAGMQDREVYALSAKHNAVVVSGSNPTVGLMGWFPGGGHGPLTSSYGMGADNLLQAVAVLPSGQVVTANECQHSDLFWALRGGGAGTFGVIVEAVMKAYPTPQTTLSTLQVDIVKDTNATDKTSRWWKMMAKFHAQLPGFKDAGGQGYYTMVGPPAAPELSMTFTCYHYDKTNATVDAAYRPLTEILDSQNGFVSYTYNKYVAPSFFEMWNATVGAGNETVATGGGYMTSRLLTRRALTQDVDAVARTFQKIGPRAASDPIILGEPVVEGLLIANDNNRGLDVALNPAWRDAVVHMIVVTSWSDGDPPAVIQNVTNDTVNNKAYALRQLSPDSGAYINEADPYEPDWQYSFFGTNYPRLLKIKEKYDPDGLLWCKLRGERGLGRKARYETLPCSVVDACLHAMASTNWAFPWLELSHNR